MITKTETITRTRTVEVQEPARAVLSLTPHELDIVGTALTNFCVMQGAGSRQKVEVNNMAGALVAAFGSDFKVGFAQARTRLRNLGFTVD